MKGRGRSRDGALDLDEPLDVVCDSERERLAARMATHTDDETPCLALHGVGTRTGTVRTPAARGAPPLVHATLGFQGKGCGIARAVRPSRSANHVGDIPPVTSNRLLSGDQAICSTFQSAR